MLVVVLVALVVLVVLLLMEKIGASAFGHGAFYALECNSSKVVQVCGGGLIYLGVHICKCFVIFFRVHRNLIRKNAL
jgi:hypothetical protein